MKKKSAKNEYAEMLSFIDSLIENKENEIDCLLNSCSDLYHEVRAREMLLEEKQKLTSSDSFLFSPNEPKELSSFDNDWLSQLDSIKKLHAEKTELLKISREEFEKYKRLRAFLVENIEGKDSSFVSDEISITQEANIQSLEIQEMERNRIANDLHDSAVQNLTGLVHKGELCMRLFDLDPIRARMEMSSIIDVARETIDDIRSSIFELRPASIDDFGLHAAIEDYCNHINPDRRITFIIESDGNEIQLPNSISVNLYRIAQEACINIIKHSKATKANIVLSYTNNEVLLTITDNGIGISKEVQDRANKSKTNFGLRILQERAALMNGDIHISNLKDGGLKIQVAVPVEN